MTDGLAAEMYAFSVSNNNWVLTRDRYHARKVRAIAAAHHISTKAVLRFVRYTLMMWMRLNVGRCPIPQDSRRVRDHVYIASSSYISQDFQGCSRRRGHFTTKADDYTFTRRRLFLALFITF